MAERLKAPDLDSGGSVREKELPVGPNPTPPIILTLFARLEKRVNLIPKGLERIAQFLAVHCRSSRGNSWVSDSPKDIIKSASSANRHSYGRRIVLEYHFPLQRAAAAFRALSLRSAAVIVSIRRLPPFRPPLRPRATAAGFFSGGTIRGSSPVSWAKIECAAWIGSDGGLRERFGIY